MFSKKTLLLFIILFTYIAYAGSNLSPAITRPIPIAQIRGYESYPPIIQQLIQKSLALTQQNLTYLYGSSDPKKAGMDCSGTIYYLLSTATSSSIPRQANEIYQWVWQKGKFYTVTSNSFASFEFSHLKPGDLLFWTGTYATHRDPPITHVMLYLGRNKQNEPLMFGASDGRTYQGKKMWGVSVFDFKLPNSSSSARFVGYGCIPGLTCNLTW